MTRRRVVVTGLGCVSPVGNTVAVNGDAAFQDSLDLVATASNASLTLAGATANVEIGRAHV
mgnify:CR=1 FL=1